AGGARVRPPMMWLSRARTSYSEHGVGRVSWSAETAATAVSVWAMARRRSGRGSEVSVMWLAWGINLTTNVIFSAEAGDGGGGGKLATEVEEGSWQRRW